MTDDERAEAVAAALYAQFEGAECHDWDEATSSDRAFCLTLANVAIETLQETP